MSKKVWASVGWALLSLSAGTIVWLLRTLGVSSVGEPVPWWFVLVLMLITEHRLDKANESVEKLRRELGLDKPNERQ